MGTDFSFSEVGMLDSGCTTCIVPYARLSNAARSAMSKPHTQVNGIGGEIRILGEINCNIALGHNSSPAFPDTNILVAASNVPILIGQNILEVVHY